MFTRNSDVARARKILIQSQEKPVVGTVLRGLKGLPVRVHCQLVRGSATEIFAYATLLPLNEDLTANGQKWFLRDFASQELAGTKVVLCQKARDRLLRIYDKHPIFNECDVLPVQALKVVKIAASNRSVEADIIDKVPDNILDVCAEFARIAMDAELPEEQLAVAQANFYEILDETRTVAEGPAA